MIGKQLAISFCLVLIVPVLAFLFGYLAEPPPMSGSRAVNEAIHLNMKISLGILAAGWALIFILRTAEYSDELAARIAIFANISSGVAVFVMGGYTFSVS